MSSVRSSLAFSAANSYLGLVLQLISTAIISRILNPHEIGVFSVAAVLAALASTFRDFGVAEYLIQKKEVTDDDLRASFTVNLASSWLMALVLYFAAPLVSAFYGEPGVGQVMTVQAMSFALIPFGAVTLAWHRRMLNFKPIMWAGVASNLVSFAVVIVMARSGFSFMSLAWSSLAGVATTVAVAYLLRPKGFPRLPGLRGLGDVVHFGKFASAVFVAGQVGKGAPELVIGKVESLAHAGIFSRANGLVEMFNRLVVQAISPVCLPYLADGARRDGSVVPSLVKVMALITGLGWPFFGFLGLAAYPAIRLMYGPQWIDSVALAQIVCLAVAIDTPFLFTNHALFASGLPRQANQRQLIVQSLRVLGVLLAIPFGVFGVAISIVVTTSISTAVSFVILRTSSRFSLRSLLEGTKASLILALLSLLPYATACLVVPASESNYLIHLFGGGFVTLTSWMVISSKLRHPIWRAMMSVIPSREA